MELILLLAFMYFIFRILRTYTGSQLPRRGVPGYNIIGDDGAPLPGPWNRPREPVESKPQMEPEKRRMEHSGDKSLPGPWDRPAGDMPLPGPWDRKREPQRPVEKGPYREPRYEDEPYGAKQQPSTLPPRDVPEKPAQRERHRTDYSDRKQRTDFSRAEPDPGEQSGPPGDRDAAAPTLPRQERRKQRSANPMEAVLANKTTLVGGIIIGEALASRGGRSSGRRRI